MPRTFLDNQGDQWAVVVDYQSAKRVRNLLEVNLLQATSQLFERLADDVILLVDVLYVICQEQADQRNVSDVDFGRRLVGDPIDGARPALLRAIADFFPTRQRNTLAAVIDKIFQAESAMLSLAAQVVETGQLDRIVEAEVDRVRDQFRQSSPPSPPGSSSIDSPAG